MLDLAAAHFAANGYAATSTQDLADALGIKKGSLYYWISTKEDFLAAIIEEAHGAYLRDNVRWKDERDPLAALRAFAEDHVRVAVANLPYVTVYLLYFFALSPRRQRPIVASRDAYDTSLRAIIERARDAGATRPDVDPRLSALAIFGMLNWLIVWYRPGGRFGVDEIAGQLATQAVASVSA